MNIQKPENFRDLGGMLTKDGRNVKKRRILRSGELTGLSDKEQHTLLEDYRLASVIDLREEEEVVKSPDMITDGVSYCNVDLNGKIQDALASDKQTLESLQNPEYVDLFMQKLYASLIRSDEVSRELSKVVDVYLRQKEGAVLVHCFAGKDRTGISIAVILTLLGIPEKEIFRDYLRTNDMRFNANQRLVREFADKSGISIDSPRAKSVLKAMSVDRSYLEAAYHAAEEKYGSFSSYIHQGIGVTKEKELILRNLYLEG